MAKKKKSAKPMDLATRRTLHRSITQQLSAMIVRCEHLRDIGKTAEARRLLARIEALAEDLKSLEK